MKNYPSLRNSFGLDLFRDDFFEPFFNFNVQSKTLKTDVKEDDKGYTLEIDAPGIDKKNIDIALENKYLTVSVTKQHENDEKDDNGNYIRKERYTGSCSRSYYVGNIKEKDISASYKDGFLKVSFPKEEPKEIEERKRIDIK